MLTYRYVFTADETRRITSAGYTMLGYAIELCAETFEAADAQFLLFIQAAFPNAEMVTLDGATVIR